MNTLPTRSDSLDTAHFSSQTTQLFGQGTFHSNLEYGYIPSASVPRMIWANTHLGFQGIEPYAMYLQDPPPGPKKKESLAEELGLLKTTMIITQYLILSDPRTFMRKDVIKSLKKSAKLYKAIKEEYEKM